MANAASLLAAFLLVLACGVFVSAEFALLSANRPALEQAAADGDSGARGVLTALQSLTTQLSGAQVGITLTNLAIGFLAEPTVSDVLKPRFEDWGLSSGAAHTASAAVALALATVVTMVLGELVPQYLALSHPTAVARVVQRPIRLFTVVTTPLSHGLNAAANRVVRAVGVEPKEELASARNPEELVFLVRRSAEQGTLQDATAELLRKVLTFDDKHASDVMTPRTRVATISGSDTVEDLLHTARETGRSRFPVVGDTVDDVRGVVSLLDAYAVPTGRRAHTRVSQIASPPHLVPSVLPLDDLLAGLLGESRQLAIVLDEFGGLDGVVSLEDLLEELVGDVHDEHEHDPEPPGLPTPASDGTWTLSGLLRPDEVADRTGVEIPDGGAVYETLAGLVMASLGRVPAVGDAVEVNGVQLRVLSMDGRRVDQVELLAPPPAAPEGDDE
jgi:CBS domain containing-hemolysin-like protein